MMARDVIARGHSQILVAEQLRNGVDVRALHSHPTRRGMSEIVEMKVGDFHRTAHARERHTDPLRFQTWKQVVDWLRVGGDL